MNLLSKSYEDGGWAVRSVEAQKLGYDLCCDRGDEQLHLETKGTQGDEVIFIVTAAEVRNAMIDRKHLTCVVTGVLTGAPKMFTYTKDESSKKIRLEPIAFRARLSPR